ncbi:MAG: TetR/AcrR family transcriptional regulator [Actinobacteria bacterium]|nr:TetR/AcrR family transcriptional regulator [Actinomycetota bacterium]
MAKKKITPRIEKGMQTRQAIFETAIALFAKRGYDKVTIDDICEKVGVTKGAFYNHFKSKDQIILEEFMRMDEHYAKVAQDISAMQSAREKLRVFNREAIKLMSDLGVTMMKVVYHSQIAPNMRKPYLMDSKRFLYRITNELIREGQKNGEIRDDLASEDMAIMLINCFRGQIYHWCLTNGSFDLVDTCERLFDLLVESLAPR